MPVIGHAVAAAYTQIRFRLTQRQTLHLKGLKMYHFVCQPSLKNSKTEVNDQHLLAKNRIKIRVRKKHMVVPLLGPRPSPTLHSSMSCLLKPRGVHLWRELLANAPLPPNCLKESQGNQICDLLERVRPISWNSLRN